MSNQQHAKDLSALVMRLASNGDIESLRLLGNSFGHIESAENPVSAAKASRIAAQCSAPLAASLMTINSIRSLASGMREVLAEASVYSGGGGFCYCETGRPLSPMEHAVKMGWDVEPCGRDKYKAFKDGVAMMEWDRE